MNLTPELIIALAGFCTGVVSVAAQWRAGMVQARKDEITLLHNEIARLQSRSEKLEAHLDKERRNKLILQDYVAKLRTQLIEQGMALPDMPSLE